MTEEFERNRLGFRSADWEFFQLERMSQEDLFALYGIQSEDDYESFEQFEQFADEIFLDNTVREEYVEAYATFIHLSAGEYSRRLVRKAGFVMEGVRLPAAKLLVYPTDQLAIIFGLDFPISQYNMHEFTGKCLAVASDPSLAELLAKRIVDSVIAYATTSNMYL